MCKLHTGRCGPAPLLRQRGIGCGLDFVEVSVQLASFPLVQSLNPLDHAAVSYSRDVPRFSPSSTFSTPAGPRFALARRIKAADNGIPTPGGIMTCYGEDSTRKVRRATFPGNSARRKEFTGIFMGPEISVGPRMQPMRLLPLVCSGHPRPSPDPTGNGHVETLRHPVSSEEATCLV